MSGDRKVTHSLIVVILVIFTALCSSMFVRCLYSLRTNYNFQVLLHFIQHGWYLAEIDYQIARTKSAIEKSRRVNEECEQKHNLYRAFSRIAGTIDDGKVTNGHCMAFRMTNGNLAWQSPENHLLAAYWDKKDSERDGQFRSESAQYIPPAGWTNSFQYVWDNRGKLVEVVDSIIEANEKIADELLQEGASFVEYDSVERPSIDLVAIGNIVRCYWCARIVRHVECGRVSIAGIELRRLVELAVIVANGANTDEEMHLAAIMVRNIQECLRTIMPYLGIELDMMQIWLQDFDDLQPKTRSKELEEALQDVDKLKLEVSRELDRRRGKEASIRRADKDFGIIRDNA